MNTDNKERSLSLAFMALLIEDVIAARQRLGGSDTQTARRDVVRASVAAMEGATWVAKEHVRTALAKVGHLSPVADLAFQELAYSVSDIGELKKRIQALPLITTIRLVVSQAEIICPGIAVEFSRAGWANLRQAILIRNRITHPKPDQNLSISDKDLAVVASGVSWLVATVEYVMASTNLALARHNRNFRETLQRLTAGDPDALAEYYLALRQGDAEE
jgi:hypothetical protein